VDQAALQARARAVVTPEHVADYQRDGAVVLDGLIGADEADAIHAELVGRYPAK
jgi:hypothetical protein